MRTHQEGCSALVLPSTLIVWLLSAQWYCQRRNHHSSDTLWRMCRFDDPSAYGHISGLDDPSMGWARYAQVQMLPCPRICVLPFWHDLHELYCLHVADAPCSEPLIVKD